MAKLTETDTGYSLDLTSREADLIYLILGQDYGATEELYALFNLLLEARNPDRDAGKDRMREGPEGDFGIDVFTISGNYRVGYE